MVLEPFLSLRWGCMHKPIRVASELSMGCQEGGDSMRVANGDAGSQEGLIVTSHIAWI
jgi:hypothetical protein